MNDMERVFARNEGTVSRSVAEEKLVIPVRGKLADLQKIFALNPVADFIWEQLDGKKSLSEICSAITASFEVETEQASRDLCELIEDLLSNDLVIEVPGN